MNLCKMVFKHHTILAMNSFTLYYNVYLFSLILNAFKFKTATAINNSFFKQDYKMIQHFERKQEIIFERLKVICVILLLKNNLYRF